MDVDPVARQTLVDEVGDRVPLPWQGDPQRLRRRALALWGHPRARASDDDFEDLAAAVACAAFRFWGRVRKGATRAKAVDAVILAAFDPASRYVQRSQAYDGGLVAEP